MFEDSMLDSRGTIKTRKGSTVVISAIVHVVLVTVLILVPLAYTEQIQGATLTFLAVPPPPPASGPPAAPAAAVAKAIVEKRVAVDPTALFEPVEVPKFTAVIVDLPADAVAGIGPGTSGVPGGRTGDGPGGRGVSGFGPPDLPSAAPPPLPPTPPPPPAPVVRIPAPIRVSGSIQAGSLLSHRNPEYPPLARTARVEGTVILSATIAEDGTIKELRIVSSTSPLLIPGLIDIVRTWRYRPTLLSNEPVEVLTTITVNFSLGGK